jgi:putative transposase
VTDQLRSYPAAKAEIPELAEVKHVSSEPVPGSTIGPKTAISQPTRERERRLRGFRDAERTQAFLSSFGLVR